MAFKIQYNKTFLHSLRKQLAIRVKVLPTLKSKETALRIEVKKAQERIGSIELEAEKFRERNSENDPLWNKFPEILSVRNALVEKKNTAGTKIPVFKEVEFSIRESSFFELPSWVDKALEQLKKEVEMELELKVLRRQFEILYRERRKTTQKVNLYEKVQIPAFEESISKIKRFLEDKENISKAAQKMVKERTQKAAA
jgi:V/A-type H+/Na+-transporting ATPase subunit D